MLPGILDIYYVVGPNLGLPWLEVATAMINPVIVF